MYPFDDQDPLDALSRIGQPPAPDYSAPRPHYPPLAPQEEEGLLSKLTGAGLSGLGYAGSVLDKALGGRAIRGLLGGRPEELASVVPFSDALGLSNEQNRVSGEDLGKQWGLLDGPGTKGEFEARDLVGPALELALDPGTYASFGAKALTGAGLKAAKAGTLARMPGEAFAQEAARATQAGKLAPTLAGRLQAGQGGLVGFGLPFADPLVTLGTGPAAQGLANLASKGYEAASYTAPGRYLSALFDPAVGGATTEPLQKLRRGNVEQAGAEDVAARGLAYQRAGEVKDVGLFGDADTVRRSLEGVQGTNLPFLVRGPGGDIRRDLADRLSLERGLGINTPTLADTHPLTGETLQYAPRYPAQIQNPALADLQPAARGVSTYHPSQEGRKAIFRYYTEGTQGINAAATDPRIAGADRLANQQAQALAQPILAQAQRYVGPARGHLTEAAEDAFNLPRGTLAGQTVDAAAVANLAQQTGRALQPGEEAKIVSGLTRTANARAARELSPQFGLDAAERHALFDSQNSLHDQLLAEAQRTAGTRAAGDFDFLPPADLERLGKGLQAKTQAARVANLLAKSKDPAAATAALTRELANAEAAKVIGPEYLGLQARHAAERPALAAAAEEMRGLGQAGAQGLDPVIAAYEARAKGIGTLDQHARGNAAYLANLEPERVKSGIFTNDPLVDFASRLQSSAKAVSNARLIHDAAAQTAIVGPQAQALVDAGEAVPLRKLLRDTGLTARDQGELVAEQNILGRLSAAHGPGVTAQEVAVPAAVARDLTRNVNKVSPGEAASGPLGLLDSARSLFKAGVTAPFPGFSARNYLGGLFNNLKEGVLSPSAQRDAQALYRGTGPIADAAERYFPGRGLTDEAATRELGRLAYAHNVLGQHITQAHGDAGPMAGLSTLVGLQPGKPVGQIAKEYVAGVKDLPDVFRNLTSPSGLGQLVTGEAGGRANPLNVQGVFGRQRDLFGPVAAGRDLNTLIEQQNRLGAMLGGLQRGLSPDAARAASTRAHFDYGNLTDFEKSVARRVVPFYCVPETTVALARDGWKAVDDLNIGDEILTYNQTDDVLEWQPCLEVAVFNHDEDLLTMSNTRHTIECTLHHRWAIRLPAVTIRRDGKEWSYPAKDQMIEAKDLRAGHTITVTAKLRAEGGPLSVEQARLLGWLVSDGYYRVRGNHLEAMIYQHPKKFLDEVKAVAGGNPRKPHPDTGVVCVPVLKERAKELRKYLDKDKLLSVVTQLSTEAAEAMYDAIYKADGTVSKWRTNDFIASQHPGNREAFLVLAFMLGKRAVLNERGLCVSAKSCLSVGALKVDKRRYKGRVWCPRTANGTWVMRQGGLVTITGNTFAKNNAVNTLQDLVRQPSGVVGRLTALDNSLRQQQGGFTPPYLGSGLNIPLGESAPGTTRYLTGLGLPFEQAFDPLKLGPTALATASNTAQGLLGQADPLIKAPLEVITGKQFYSGRDLHDLYGVSGVPLLDQVLANSPLSRVEGTLKTLADPRKGVGATALNLLTGAKVSDVDVGKSKDVVARDALEELLRGAPGAGFRTEVYPRAGLAQTLTPDQQDLLRLYAGIEKRAADRAKQAQQQGR